MGRERPSVRPAQASEADRISALLLLAFAGDPGTRATFAEPERYLARFPGFLAAYARPAYAHGTAFVAGDFLGASLWLPPGVEHDVTAVATAVLEDAPPSLFDGRLEPFAKLGEMHPKEPHWYLAMLGVDPRHQGHGAGSALLATELERVDADGLPAFLETTSSQNLPLYERFGFEVLEELRAPDGSFSVFPMLRPAR